MPERLDRGEIAIDQARSQLGVAEGGLDAEQAQFGTAQNKGQRKGVVDVVADIGVQNDQLGRWMGLSGGWTVGWGRCGHSEQQRGEREQRSRTVHAAHCSRCDGGWARGGPVGIGH